MMIAEQFQGPPPEIEDNVDPDWEPNPEEQAEHLQFILELGQLLDELREQHLAEQPRWPQPGDPDWVDWDAPAE